MRITRIALLPLAALSVLAVTAPAEAATAHRKLLVELREEGGFAGLHNRVAVYTDGCAVLSRRTGPTVRKCLTAAEWRGLRGSLKHLRLGRSESQPPGADFIAYRLAYKGHRATRYTLPPTWQPVVSRMEKVLVKYWAPN
ncbi:hypothetical protein [Microbispora sp. H10830]|uniref:hypothetical protein n=1 Tax=Microbispora sp. H10830 TaxID=2729109 RepID=UPI0016004F1E|nr:hypothetical protein [Microbispora sp. H10830]